jgi:hypothetical protein
MPRQPEGKLVAKIREMISDRGGRAFKIHGSGEGFQEIGIPDILACYQGRFIGLEVKMPGGRVSPKQEQILKQIETAGGIAAVVTSVHEAKKALDRAIPIEVAAWIGGFFDGEGCIIIYQERYPRVTITQKDDRPLVWIHETLGLGRVVYRSGVNRSGKSRAPYLSIARREEVIRFLDLIDPYVRLHHRRLKLEEARIAISHTSSISTSY